MIYYVSVLCLAKTKDIDQEGWDNIKSLKRLDWDFLITLHPSLYVEIMPEFVPKWSQKKLQNAVLFALNHMKISKTMEMIFNLEKNNDKL